MKVYIITSAKFEECYVEEWVKYHLNIGFDKIIINDNNPKDYPYQLKDILKKYIDEGTVVIERYYDHFGHSDDPEKEFPNIYMWLYNKYKNEFDWFSKLDIDEFIKIGETNNDIKKFLSQKKFNNMLCILLPLLPHSVKKEYHEKYTRLKNNCDRFERTDESILETYYVKSIARKTNHLQNITHHIPGYDINYNNQDNITVFGFPDGSNPQLKVYMYTEFTEEGHIAINNKKRYYFDNANICCINHYANKSAEEWDYKTLKFEADCYDTSPYRNAYLNLSNNNILDNQRDLYKLYFIDNINNIQED